MNVARPAAALLGFFAASLVPPIVFVSRGASDGAVGLLDIFAAFLLLLFFSVAMVALFGVPAFLLLRRFKLVDWWSALGTGLVIGAVLGFLIGAPDSPEISDVLTMAGTGAASGLAFWFVYRTISAQPPGMLRGGSRE
jgi:hypothetical protein